MVWCHVLIWLVIIIRKKLYREGLVVIKAKKIFYFGRLYIINFFCDLKIIVKYKKRGF